MAGRSIFVSRRDLRLSPSLRRPGRRLHAKRCRRCCGLIWKRRRPARDCGVPCTSSAELSGKTSSRPIEFLCGSTRPPTFPSIQRRSKQPATGISSPMQCAYTKAISSRGCRSPDARNSMTGPFSAAKRFVCRAQWRPDLVRRLWKWSGSHSAARRTRQCGELGISGAGPS